MSRRPIAVSAAALAAGAVLVAGCSSKAKTSASPSGSVPIASNATASVTVSGAFGSTPTIKLLSTKPPKVTEVSVVSKGTGAALKVGDLAVVDDYGRTWRSSATFQDTFGDAEPPDTLPVGTGEIQLAGLDKALVGVPVGSRVLVLLPPNAGFGNVSTALPTGVTKDDTAVLVFDVRAAYGANAGPTGTAVSSGGGPLPTVSGGLTSKPVITIPKTAAPTALSATTLIQGSGATTASGDELVVQYVGQIWATGKEFDSSWSRNMPSGFTVGVGELIPAWDKALVGVKVGSRVLLVVPPADGYGSAGESGAGISGTDTLVFVIDILGAFPA
jgi:FKBP-type peptidyl-prolyl cis-trans isomerase